MKLLVSVIACVLLFAVAPAVSAQEAPPTLNVQGGGEVRVVPDQAMVRLGVMEQLPTAEEAQQEVNRVAGAIREGVRNEGIDDRQIQTSRLILSPIYARQNPGATEAPRVVAYRASNTVSILVEDLDRVGAVIDAALDAGANALEGVSFGLMNDLDARLEALRAAAAEARRKAEVMADALGVELGGIRSISEGGGSFQPPRIEMAGRAMALAAGDAPTPVSPGELTVSASVSVQYAIVQSGAQPE